MQNKQFYMVFASCIAFLLILVAGCVSSSESGTSPNATILPTVKLNVCITDPENADLWSSGPVNLWDAPGESRTKKVGELAACKNIPVTILDESGEYIKITSGSQKGWVLKAIVMGEIDSDDDKAFYDKSKTTSVGLTIALKNWSSATDTDNFNLIHQTTQTLVNEIDNWATELESMPVTSKMAPVKLEYLLSWSEMRAGLMDLDSAYQSAENGDTDAATKTLTRAQVLLGNYSAHDKKADQLYAKLYPTSNVGQYSTIQVDTTTKSDAKYETGDIAGGGTGGNWYYAAVKSYDYGTYVYYDLPEYTKSSSQYFGTTKLGDVHRMSQSAFEQKYPNLYFTGRSMP